MNQPKVCELIPEMTFTGFLKVISADKRTSNKNGSQYLDMTRGDRTGDMNAKVWDQNAQPPKTGSIIKVQAAIQEYNGRLQMKILRMRPAGPEDPVEMDALMKCAPEKPADMFGELKDTVEAMQWEDLKKLMRVMLDSVGDKLLYYPAAQRLHHAERSGLLHHTVSMLRVAKAVAPLYPFLNQDLLFAGVIAHDLDKTVEMCADEDGTVSDYTPEGLLIGHLVDGVARVRECAKEAGVEGECVLLLCHMLLSHHGQAEFGSPKAPMFPEAEALHMIDDLDAKLNEMEDVMQRTPEGVFSEKIWSLDRRLYHPKYPKPETEEMKELDVTAQNEALYNGLL
ncbi:MAG: CMP-binding protein [Clostridia bacterium]|nr:CMP-binding protein [Clostridia bacterium]